MLRARARFGFTLLLLFVLFASSSAQQQRPFNPSTAADKEILVKFKTVIPGTLLSSIAQSQDVQQVRRIGGVHNLYHFRSRTRDVERMIKQLSARPDVAYAEPNYLVQTLGVPNDPGFPQLWAFQNTAQSYGFPAGTSGADISAVPAWDISTGNTTNVIAIVDTGIDYTHPDLVPNIWSAPAAFTLNIGGTNISCPKGSHGFNAITWTCDPMDDNQHGTHVAGTIGATGNNATGVVGVNWTTQIVSLKFLNAGGSGSLADAINAIEFAVQLKMLPNPPAVLRVLSNSWGGSGFSQALMDEIQRVADQDMLFVAAAGNSSSNNDITPAYPAAYPLSNVIAVAATDNNDALASFSNYGLKTVHLGAPGVNIFSTLPKNTYGYLSGTSMATPHVSGAAMLVLSTCDLATADLKQVLLQNVDPIPSLTGITSTGGRLNVNKAIRACSGPASIAPQTISFGRIQVGSSAGPRQLTLSNNQDVDLNVYSITSTDPQFLLQNNCGALLAARTNCQLSVSFVPTTLGDFSASVLVADSAPNNPQSVVLKGSGSEDPDLAMTSLVVPTKPAAAGGSVPVAATVTNPGIFSTPVSLTGFYLTKNGLRDSNSRLLAQLPLPSIPAAGAFVQNVTLSIPANTTAGSYRMMACADDGNSVTETDETNNCATAALTIALADLIETGVSVSTSKVGAGGSLQITDTATNQGGADAGVSVTQYYISTSPSKNSNARLLTGSRSIATLAAGSSSIGSALITLPSDLAAGSYYVLACADDTSLIVETSETNNCATSSSKVTAGPDLIETGVTVSASKIGAGGSLQITDTITNQGGGDAVASVTQYYISTSTSKNSNARLLTGSRSVATLAAGSGSTGATLVTVPSDLAVGSYYLLACADDTSLVIETSETNNCTAATTRVSAGPDLVETGVTLSATKIAAGGALQITETITNQGGGNAGASVTQYYISTGSSKNSNARLLTGSRSIGDLTAGSSSTGLALVTLPSDLAVGSYYVLACADDTNLVAETSEANNCTAATTTVSAGPDLIESGLTLSATKVASGGSLQVTDTVTNQGGGNAGASVTQYYISTGASKNSNARLLAGSRSIASVSGGSGSTGPAIVILPSDLAVGSYYVLACADDTNLVVETSETNNCTAATTKVSAGPDLIETGVTLGATKVAAGGTLQITETVTNQGGGDAGASVTQYYISTGSSRNGNARLLTGSRSIAVLTAGSGSAGTALVSVPSDLAAGTYYVLSCADDTNLIVETSETNNCTAAALRLTIVAQ